MKLVATLIAGLFAMSVFAQNTAPAKAEAKKEEAKPAAKAEAKKDEKKAAEPAKK